MNDTATSEKEGKSNGFIQRLKEYKELIAIIIFFIGGVLWVYGIFATKKQIKELKCLLNTNISIVQNQMMQKLSRDELIENQLRQEAIRNKDNFSPLDSKDLLELEHDADKLQKRIDNALKSYEGAINFLQRDGCSDE